jgi:hypothetical protein
MGAQEMPGNQIYRIKWLSIGDHNRDAGALVVLAAPSDRNAVEQR